MQSSAGMFETSYNANAYERGRPDYPVAAVEHLLDALEVSHGSTVLDLAAGTGKFTRNLVSRGAEVTALEPEPSMREKLSRRLSGVAVHEGLATSIPLPDDSMDAVTVAQAFQWFATRDALAEISRVLRPGHGLGLIWNVRDLDTAIHRAIERIYGEYRKDSPTYRGTDWRAAFQDPDSPFGPLQHAEFAHRHLVDKEGLHALVLSTSYMSRLAPKELEVVSAAVADVFAEFALDGKSVELFYHTEIFWAYLPS